MNRGTRTVTYLCIILISTGCPKPLSVNDLYTAQATLLEDEPVHFKNSLEWWYFTGHLRDTVSQKEYGIEYVFFHFNPRDKNDYLMANFAISDPEEEAFHYDYKLYKSDSLLTPALPVRLSIPYHDEIWSLQGQSGNYHLRATMKRNSGYSLDLTTTPLTAPWMHGGGRGFQKYGKYAEAGYYSFPQLKTEGLLQINGALVPVKGMLWYDRQWNCIGVYQKKVAWDWMSVQLDENQGDLMLFKLYHRSDQTVVYGGSYRDPEGNNIALGPEDLEMTAVEYWKSPRSKINYPIAWQVELPSLNMALQVRARFPKQELSLKFTALYQLHYWEGMCAVTGSKNGEPISGVSYVEITNRSKKKVYEGLGQ